MDNLGVNFAPTQDAAINGPRNGALSGVPQAIQILSLALPKFFGARAPVAPQLATAQGGQGMDPAASALFQTIMKTLAGHAMGLPGGTAGPNPPLPGSPYPPAPHSPFPRQENDPIPSPSTEMDYTPRVVFQPGPTTSPEVRPLFTGSAMGRGKIGA